MVRLGDIFTIHRGSFWGLDLPPGDTPLVTATTDGNGVDKMVTPPDGEPLFNTPCIAVAVNGAPMFATVHLHGQILCNDSVEILEPRMDCDTSFLVVIASLIRQNVWRFSYGRKGRGRLADLETDLALVHELAAQLPPPAASCVAPLDAVDLSPFDGFTVGDLFAPIAGHASIATGDLKDEGEIAVISASEKNNGVAGYLDVQDLPADAVVHTEPMVSVAKDGRPGVARVQTGRFTGSGHVIMLRPLVSLDLSALHLAAALIEHQSWRFCYGRAATWERLRDIPLVGVVEEVSAPEPVVIAQDQPRAVVGGQMMLF